MANEHVANPLSIRIIRQNTKLLLELQSAANVELTEIQISPIFVQGYDNVNENIMIKFASFQSLPLANDQWLRTKHIFQKRIRLATTYGKNPTTSTIS